MLAAEIGLTQVLIYSGAEAVNWQSFGMCEGAKVLEPEWERKEAASVCKKSLMKEFSVTEK